MKAFPYKFVRTEKTEECSKKINQLTFDIENATDFIKNIETGNLDAEYKGISDTENIDENSLPGSLISMRDQMKMIAEQEHERNWATEGIARFVEILRSNNDDISTLSDKILSNLVKYLNANQGHLFILDDTSAEDKFLNLTACYAYNKKKYINQRLEIGEGLVGQCFLEKETIYLTDVPAGYVKITSGLGESLPRNIIIVPLKLNEEIYGIVEIASFQVIKKYQVEFLEKLGESIASTIANVNVNERTKRLLGDAQLMAEQLRSQEEEMRQNMEELSATQEEMQRRQAELNEANGRFDLVNKSSSEGLWDLNLSNGFNPDEDAPIWFSEQFCALLGFKQNELTGKVSSWMSRIHPDDIEKVMGNFNSHISDITNKTLYDIDYRMKVKSGEYRWFKSRGTTLRDELGNPLRVAGALKDIHEERMAFEKIQSMLEEIKAKEDYMNNVINASTDSIYTIDKNYKIVTFNKTFSETISSFGFKIERGTDVFLAFGEVQDNNESKVKYDAVLTGESIDESIEHSGFHFNIKYNPIRNSNEEIIGISVFSKDVTTQTKLKLETERLLAASQQQAEELKAQEEELRQNMEELSATQDEMQIVLKNVQEKEQYLSELINVSNDSIYTVDRNYKLISYNRKLVSELEAMGIKAIKGFDMLQFFDGNAEEKQKSKAIYDRAFNGENFVITSDFEVDGHVTYHMLNYAPLRNENGEIIAVAAYTKDVTETVVARNKTEQLLAASQQQAEELKAQEEELRQNMEELSATQEEIQNILKDVKDKEQYLSELINVSSDSIFTVDKTYGLISYNRKLANDLEAMGMQVTKGFDMLQFFTDTAEKQKNQALYDRAFKGESFTLTADFAIEGHTIYHMMSYAPIRNENGDIIAVAVYTKDITEMVTARHQTEQLLSASQQQAEELKAQEEELRQNMEELSATQDEMQNILEDVQGKEQYLNELLNVSSDSILTLDKSYKVLSHNRVFTAIFEARGVIVGKGFDILNIFTEEDKVKKTALYERIFAGETIELLDHLSTDGFDDYFLVTHSPIREKNGEITSIAIFAKDVTTMTKAQQKAEKLATEAQQQAEELKAQEEELRQSMEELSATQDEMQKKTLEIEEIRRREKERADNQIESQKKLMEQFIAKTKEKEEAMLARIKELESKAGLSITPAGVEVQLNGKAKGHVKATSKA